MRSILLISIFLAAISIQSYAKDLVTGWKARVTARSVPFSSERLGHTLSRGEYNTTVIDNTSQLIWEDNVTSAATKMKWDEANAYCADLNLAGSNAWRLPTIKEMVALTDKTFYASPADMDIFYANNQKDAYWSGTVSENDIVWTLSYKYGNDLTAQKDESHYVRCVHEMSSYDVSPNGYSRGEDNVTVYDIDNNITWVDVNSSALFTYYEAYDLCVQKGDENGVAMRLPTFDELYTIVDHNRSNPAVKESFTSINANGFYWTSTPTSAQIDPPGHWILYLSYGFDGAAPDNNNSIKGHALCIANGKIKMNKSETGDTASSESSSEASTPAEGASSSNTSNSSSSASTRSLKEQEAQKVTEYLINLETNLTINGYYGQYTFSDDSKSNWAYVTKSDQKVYQLFGQEPSATNVFGFEEKTDVNASEIPEEYYFVFLGTWDSDQGADTLYSWLFINKNTHEVRKLYGKSDQGYFDYSEPLNVTYTIDGDHIKFNAK